MPDGRARMGNGCCGLPATATAHTATLRARPRLDACPTRSTARCPRTRNSCRSGSRSTVRAQRWRPRVQPASPTLDASASATRYAYPTFVHGIREVGVFPPLDQTIYDLGLALKLPLYSGGRVAQGIVLADLGQQIARERERLSAQELTFNVSSVYFKIQQLDALAQVYTARIASLDAQLQRAKLLRESGKTGKLDQLKITTLLTKARHDRLQIENRGREAWTLLYQLSGLPRPAQSQAPTLSLYVPAWTAEMSLDQLRQQALAQRPELQIAQRQSAAGQAKEELARGEQRPSVSLVSGLHGRSGGSGRVYDDWSIGVQLSVPLFDGGVRRARVDEASTARQQAELAVQQTRLEVDRQIEDAWNAHAEAASRLRVTATSVAEAERGAGDREPQAGSGRGPGHRCVERRDGAAGRAGRSVAGALRSHHHALRPAARHRGVEPPSRRYAGDARQRRSQRQP